jgi:transcriptional regulator with XRE-family HTH domain
MSPHVQAIDASPQEPEAPTPWWILTLAQTLFEQAFSTTTRLGRPIVRQGLDYFLPSAERMTGASSSFGEQFWQTYLSSTDSGITYETTPRSVREEVERLRDDISRRTRLTRQQIARAVGVDRRSLSAWVKGSATPSVDKLERLRVLAEVIRDIDATVPGRSTEVLLGRADGTDLLDHVAAGRIHRANDWQTFQGSNPSVTIQHRRSNKRPLHQKALEAYLTGKLQPLGRATTVRSASDYEQDLSEADRLMPDESIRRSRPGYQ